MNVTYRCPTCGGANVGWKAGLGPDDVQVGTHSRTGGCVRVLRCPDCGTETVYRVHEGGKGNDR